MAAKRGELHHKARLTAQEVTELRELYATGEWSYMRLAERINYRVDESTIGSVIRRETWKCI